MLASIMNGQFQDAHRKIERAKKHTADIDVMVRALKESGTPDIRRDVPSGGYMIYYEIADIERITNELALTTGDAIHNLKTALDYAWLGALERVTKSGNDHRKFPIADSLEKLNAMVKGAKVESLSPELFKCLMEEIRSHADGNYELWAIHRLDIADKHKLVLPVMNNVGVEGLSVRFPTGEVRTGGTWGFPYARGFHIDFDPSCVIENPGRLLISVLFAKHLPYSHQQIAPTLEIFSRVVTQVVGLLESIPYRH